MRILNRCDGCKHHYWSAPDGCLGNPQPRSWCLYFKAAIPMIIEKVKTCSGGSEKNWIGNQIPDGCPTYKPR